MRWPIDTSQVKFMVLAAAEPLRRYEGGKPREAWPPRTDATSGDLLWRLRLVALGEADAEIIRVTVPGEPKVAPGDIVRVEGLTAQPWELDARSGMAFRASGIGSTIARQQPV